MEGGSRTPNEGGRDAPGWKDAAGQPGAEFFCARYILAPRLVGHLACGELAVEPVLGPARVAGVRHSEDGNADDRGRDTAGDEASST